MIFVHQEHIFFRRRGSWLIVVVDASLEIYSV